MICPDCEASLPAKALRCKCGWKAVDAVGASRPDHRCPNHPERVGTISPVTFAGAGPHPGPFYCSECGRAAALDAQLPTTPLVGRKALGDIKGILGMVTIAREPGADEGEEDPAPTTVPATETPIGVSESPIRVSVPDDDWEV